MYSKSPVSLFSRAITAGASALAVFAALAAPPAQAATGDLDPGFGNYGRVAPVPGVRGTVWSIERTDANGIFVGGGAVLPTSLTRCTIRNESFASWLDENGAGDELNTSHVLGVEARNVLRQADGAIVGVGRQVRGITNFSSRCFRRYRLAAFRIDSNGQLDTGFAADGILEWPDEDSQASSLALEADGRIVIAGVAPLVDGDLYETRVHVLRLLSDGSLDPTFGANGIYVGPAAEVLEEVRIARVPSGNYRIAAGGPAGHVVIGLTTAGAPDENFGVAGIVSVVSPGGEPAICNSLEPLADGGLLLAGSVGERGFVTRLLAGGAPDPAFIADAALIDSMAAVTALERAVDGHVLVAGSGSERMSIARLQSTGQRDTLFGDDGRTWIDLPQDSQSTPQIRDLSIDEDGSVLAAGGTSSFFGTPFVVRLLGEAGGQSGGVLSISGGVVTPQESDGRAIVRVRRSGGGDGHVSVDYRTVVDGNATDNGDFRAASGSLDWTDGDRSEREIVVEITQDNGPPEVTESFRIELADAQGGAGLGVRGATIEIQPDGVPGGQIEIGGADPTSGVESNMQVWLNRSYYFEGRVCVTLTASSGTAIAGEDFDETPSTHCWDDQDTEAKLAEVLIVDDNNSETDETFNIELSNPTGGAIIGQQGLLTVGIAANDQPTSPPPPPPAPAPAPDNGGGGAAGVPELLLGLIWLFARRRRLD